MEFLFILYYLSFLSVSIEQCKKIMKESVDRGVAHSTYYVTKQPLADVIYRMAQNFDGGKF